MIGFVYCIVRCTETVLVKAGQSKDVIDLREGNIALFNQIKWQADFITDMVAISAEFRKALFPARTACDHELT